MGWENRSRTNSTIRFVDTADTIDDHRVRVRIAHVVLAIERLNGFEGDAIYAERTENWRTVLNEVTV